MNLTTTVRPQASSVSAEMPDDDAALTALAASLEKQLDQAARASGFLSYTDMQRHLEAEGERLDKSRRQALLKRLVPLHEDVTQHASKPKLPPVDAAGLVAVADMARSVARLIRILLVGYTADEVEELRSRMAAERTAELDGPASQAQAMQDHETSMARLNDLSASTLKKVVP